MISISINCSVTPRASDRLTSDRSFAAFRFSVERDIVPRPRGGGLLQLPLVGVHRVGDNVHLQPVLVHLHEAVHPDGSTVRRDGRLRFYRAVRNRRSRLQREVRLRAGQPEGDRSIGRESRRGLQSSLALFGRWNRRLRNRSGSFDREAKGAP